MGENDTRSSGGAAEQRSSPQAEMKTVGPNGEERIRAREGRSGVCARPARDARSARDARGLMEGSRTTSLVAPRPPSSFPLANFFSLNAFSFSFNVPPTPSSGDGRSPLELAVGAAWPWAAEADAEAEEGVVGGTEVVAAPVTAAGAGSLPLGSWPCPSLTSSEEPGFFMRDMNWFRRLEAIVDVV